MTMKIVTTAALLGAGMLALTASTASAEIVCNNDGDCWHVKQRYTYAPDLNLRVHPDNWKWREADHYRWREHEGHGYWRGGVWIGL
jgi:hypothetical protein